MLGSVAQLIALTTFGNASLRNDADGVRSLTFYPANSTFQFCQCVRYVDITASDKAKQETAWAADPTAWLERLKNEGYIALRLHNGAQDATMTEKAAVPDRMLVGFVGAGGRWLIEAIGPRGSDYWEGRWDLGDRARADRRIWRVTYGRIAASLVTPGASPDDLEELRRTLDTAFLDIGAYASSRKLDNFAAIFEKSRMQLTTEVTGSDLDYTDLTLKGQLSSTAERLLAASQLGWVFGGMGSWNDVAPQADEEYDRLSEKLFRLLNRTYVEVANTTAHPGNIEAVAQGMRAEGRPPPNT
jgi:hypothetical protein